MLPFCFPQFLCIISLVEKMGLIWFRLSSSFLYRIIGSYLAVLCPRVIISKTKTKLSPSVFENTDRFVSFYLDTSIIL